jgi:hypothetical protein
MRTPPQQAVVPLPVTPGSGGRSTGRFVLAQPISGAVGENRRTTHVFVAVMRPSRCLMALCGFRAQLGTVDLLHEQTGRLCEWCLVVAASCRQDHA